MLPYLFLAPLLSELVNLPAPLPTGVALASAVAIGGGYAVASLFLLRPALRFDPSLRSLRDLALLMLAAVASAGLVALSYVAIVIVAGLLPPKDLMTATVLYWVGDVIGVAVITPFALIALTRPALPRLSLEAVLQIAAITAALALISVSRRSSSSSCSICCFCRSYGWRCVPGSKASAGASFDQLGLIAGVELFRDDLQDLMAFQVLMLVLSVTGLVAGELVSEGRRTEAQLRLHRESLGQVARLGNLGELAAAVAHEMQSAARRRGHLHPARQRRAARRLRRPRDAGGDGGEGRGADRTCRGGGAAIACAGSPRPQRPHCLQRRTHRQGNRRPMSAGARPEPHHRPYSIDPALPLVTADTLQIGQTLLNLMRNAIEAIAAGRKAEGLITIEAMPGHAGDVEIRVADSGRDFHPTSPTIRSFR